MLPFHLENSQRFIVNGFQSKVFYNLSLLIVELQHNNRKNKKILKQLYYSFRVLLLYIFINFLDFMLNA